MPAHAIVHADSSSGNVCPTHVLHLTAFATFDTTPQGLRLNTNHCSAALALEPQNMLSRNQSIKFLFVQVGKKGFRWNPNSYCVFVVDIVAFLFKIHWHICTDKGSYSEVVIPICCTLKNEHRIFCFNMSSPP